MGLFDPAKGQGSGTASLLCTERVYAYKYVLFPKLTSIFRSLVLIRPKMRQSFCVNLPTIATLSNSAVEALPVLEFFVVVAHPHSPPTLFPRPACPIVS